MEVNYDQFIGHYPNLMSPELCDTYIDWWDMLHETEVGGYVPESPTLKTETKRDPLNLLSFCKKIEKSLGRKKSEKNSPRICDIDILDFDKRSIKNGIILPHPRLHQRNFVLIPLFEINKNWVHPKSKNHIKTLISKLSNKDITCIKQI